LKIYEAYDDVIALIKLGKIAIVSKTN